MNTKGGNFNRRNLIAATAALAGLAGATGQALAAADFLTAETLEPATAPVWRFAVGATVDHRTGNMRSIVVSRGHSSNGMEFYGVRAINPDDPQRDRIMLGEALVAA